MLLYNAFAKVLLKLTAVISVTFRQWVVGLLSRRLGVSIVELFRWNHGLLSGKRGQRWRGRRGLWQRHNAIVTDWRLHLDLHHLGLLLIGWVAGRLTATATERRCPGIAAGVGRIAAVGGRIGGVGGWSGG